MDGEAWSCIAMDKDKIGCGEAWSCMAMDKVALRQCRVVQGSRAV